jgi:HEAT repeat protein
MMDEDFIPTKITQPALFDFSPTSSNAVELFPAVWAASEALAAPEVETRRAALDRLLELGAPRISPLVAYLLSTRLTDPDLPLRARVIRALGEIFTNDELGNPAPERVRQTLTTYLSQIRIRPVFALLEVASEDQGLEAPLAQLLNACPYAGNHLASILSDRKSPLPIRLQAARMIGMVGYLDAISNLEKIEIRLLSRVNGQQAMPFLSGGVTDESELLPAIQTTLAILRGL